MAAVRADRRRRRAAAHRPRQRDRARDSHSARAAWRAQRRRADRPSGQALGIVTSMAIRGTTVVIPASIAWAAATKVATEGGTQQGFLGVSSMAVPIARTSASGPSAAASAC